MLSSTKPRKRFIYQCDVYLEVDDEFASVQEQNCILMQPTANMTVEDIVHGMSFCASF